MKKLRGDFGDGRVDIKCNLRNRRRKVKANPAGFKLIEPKANTY